MKIKIIVVKGYGTQVFPHFKQKLPDFSQAREFSLIISNLSNSSKFLLHYVKIDK
mgnify:CR=1 FL=1